MKRIALFSWPFALLLLAVTLFAPPASAQRGPGGQGQALTPEQRVERHLDRLEARLDLTDTQREQARTLMLAHHRERLDWLEANPDATRPERRDFFTEHRAALREALGRVLTDEQLDAFEALRTQRPGMRGQGMRGQGMRGQGMRGGCMGCANMRGANVRGPVQGPGNMVGRMATALDLTNEQIAELRDVMTAHHEEGRAWFDDHPEATVEERQAFRQAHRQMLVGKLESVLDEEQLATFETMWQQRRGLRGQGLRGRGVRGARGPGMGAAALADRLELTAAQRDELQALRTEHRAEARAWFAAHPEASVEARRAFRVEHRAAMRERLADVLTADQLAELDAWRAERPMRRGGPGQAPPPEPAAGSPGLGPVGGQAAAAFDLENVPNPFNPSTEIRFTLDQAADVTLVVYDVQGREVERLLEGRIGAGTHRASFDAGDRPSGVYFYRLTAGDRTATGRMTLVK